ncbi:MAG: Hsp20/alpha crystallin family protein [Gammaproteobacteria bacterium]
MKLIHYDPLQMLGNDKGMLNRMRNQLNHMFDYDLALFRDEDTEVATGNWSPSVDIREEDKQYVFVADIPGVDPKDIEVTAVNGTLTIKGEREEEKKEEKKNYKRVERSWGSFYRRFNLPDDADADRIDAKSKNGVLEVSIPRVEAAKPKKITVKS